MDIKRENELLEAAGILYLTSDNCRFEKKGDFLSVTLISDENKEYPRINLHRMFPYDMPYSYISVLDPDSNEIGIISSCESFDSETVDLIKNELDRKYYICNLSSVSSVRDRFGFSYWKAEGPDGEITFTIRDAHNSLRLNKDGEVLINDIDGNRYILPKFDSLDIKSRRILELYL